MPRSNPSATVRDSLGPPPPAYRQWVARLAATGWICQGSLVSRTLRRQVAGVWRDKGPYYFWTCKIAGKTVCHALSRPQYEHLKRAIAANRQLMKIVAKMQRAAFDAILTNVPGVSPRK
jgi:hypothetical protein